MATLIAVLTYFGRAFLGIVAIAMAVTTWCAIRGETAAWPIVGVLVLFAVMLMMGLTSLRLAARAIKLLGP